MNVRDNLEAGQYENTLVYPNMATHNCKDKVREARKEYQAEEDRLTTQLRQDLALEHGVYQHSKEPLLWKLAWDEGHASGYHEVVGYYERMVELIR